MKGNITVAALILSLNLSMSAFSADTEDPVQQSLLDEWTIPACDSVTGSYCVTFTTDEGLTLAYRTPANSQFITTDVTCLDQPNVMLSAVYTRAGIHLERSEDAGCTWKELGTNGRIQELLTITPAPGGRAYAWGHDTKTLYRIDGDEIVRLWPALKVVGLAVDPEDPDHIRIGTPDCQLMESFNGGVTLVLLGQPANTGNYLTSFYTVEFSPHDWDCAMCGTMGVWRTTDAGETWEIVPPFNQADPDVMRNFAFSPTDPQRVWAQGTMQSEIESHKEVLMSDDGGASFTTVLEAYDEAVDQNGITRKLMLGSMVPLYPRPGNPDLLYMGAGSYFQGYGTDIWRYDAAAEQLSVVHRDDLDDLTAIAFNPADPSYMYLGAGNAHATAPEPSDKLAAEAHALMSKVAPNPFNPTAEISFTLPQACQVKLDIYNIMGQRVGTLVDSYLSAGAHTFTWDGSRAASGVYLYRLQAGETVTTEKMMLIK